ncbi:MAG: hypothetical protein K8H88_09400, partial [Sandaracinaceae bacterium]|nr:hypothetical protein [Sandaracinaceae bacterium]
GWDAGRDGGPDAGPNDAGDAGSGCPSPCTGNTPYCDALARRCVACLEHAHCELDGDPCTVDRCGAGTCSSTPDPSCVVQVEAGGSHTCGRLGARTVKCWGDNSSGQLGDTSTADRPRPDLVNNLLDAIDVSAGNLHTCAVRTTGTAVCWGANTNGQLGNGDGSLMMSSAPIAVTSLAGAVDVEAGGSFSCARRNSGSVACWGNNLSGQLGNGSGGLSSASPVEVMGIADAVELTTGDSHACARLASGTVRCWGANGFGQLGDGSTTDRRAPVAVMSLTDATEIAAGGYHTCARRATGVVVCWGRNLRGQLGDGSMVNSSVPVAVADLADASLVEVGNSHSCAGRDSGAAVCWGQNGTGQLGDGSSLASPRPVAVTGLSDAIGLSVGSNHACARRATAEVVCWGTNTEGQLGDGTRTNRTTPVTVIGL